MTRELGAALGIALLGAMLASGYRSAISPRLSDMPDAMAETATEGLAHATAVGAAGGPYAELVVRAAQEAFVAGWRQAMWAGVVVMAALLVLVVLRGAERRRRRTRALRRSSSADLPRT